MQISPEKIQEILERTDMVALVSRYVDLKKSGRSFTGLCPFHAEKTPSFHVNPERRSFKCFGCGIGGDAISFLRQHTGQSFVEVALSLAKEAAVDIEQRDNPAARERASLHEVTELARRHFEERLWAEAPGRLGRMHLADRGVSQETAKLFGLGYAVSSWNDLTSRLVKEGVVEWGARAGLCAPRKQDNGYFDVFRGRLMIPIRSPEGRTVAFGARLIQAQSPGEETRPGAEAGPKYLNSRESPLYRKSEVLYALDLAKDEIRRQKSAILVEGYFDVIGLVAAGVKNAVALCSTALTPGHFAALHRFDAQELILLLDGDSAGLKAVERLAAPILAAGVKARVASLPSGDDPDTFVLREGKPALDRLIATAPTLSLHLLDRALPGGRASSFEEKMAALGRFKPILEPMPSGIAKTMIIGQVAEHLGVAESQVKAFLAEEVKAPKRPAKPVGDAAGQAHGRAIDAPDPRDPKEEFFAALLIADANLLAEPEARLADEMRSLELRVLLAGERPREGLGALSEAARRGIERQLGEIERTLRSPDERRRALVDTSRALRLTRVEEDLQAKKSELQEAVASGEGIERLQMEHKQLADLRARLCPRAAKAVASARGSPL